MRFLITLTSRQTGLRIPINYQYPLSAALYRIIAKGDKEYAAFLHQTGYGKGFKLFTFSQINSPFRIEGDRLRLLSSELSFQVAFHLPRAMETFIKGLFQSEQIEIADSRSGAGFVIKSVETLPDPLQSFKDNEIINIRAKPLAAIVAGLQNAHGHYDFLSPDDIRFGESLVYNWRNKIAASYDEATAAAAVLMTEVKPAKHPYKSRLITIKYGKPEETKIRGWLNLSLHITAEKRFVELLLNAGCGLYNAMGCGCVEVGNRISN